MDIDRTLTMNDFKGTLRETYVEMIEDMKNTDPTFEAMMTSYHLVEIKFNGGPVQSSAQLYGLFEHWEEAPVDGKIHYKYLFDFDFLSYQIPRSNGIPYIELKEKTLYPKIAYTIPSSNNIAEQVLLSNLNFEFQQKDIENDMIATCRIVTLLEYMYYNTRTGSLNVLDSYISAESPGKFKGIISLDGKIIFLINALKDLEKHFGDSIDISYYFEKIFNLEPYMLKARYSGLSDQLSDIMDFKRNWRSYSEEDIYYFVDEILREIYPEGNKYVNLVLNPSSRDRQEIRDLLNDIRLIIEDILKIKTSGENNFPVKTPKYKISGESKFPERFVKILNNFLNHALLQNGELPFDLLPNKRLRQLLTKGGSAPRFYDILIFKTYLKWLSNSFYGSDINRLNYHVYEMGTPGTELHDLVYTENAIHREFTGVKFLSDLPEPPKLYFSTRTDKSIKVYQINEMKKLISLELDSPSHYEKGSVAMHVKYTDQNGNLHIVPFSILGDTMLMINLDNVHNRQFPFVRDHPENFFTETLVDKKKDYTKKIYGDKGRFLGTYYGADGMKCIFYESGGFISVEYLTVKPFNMLGLRAQYNVPVVNIVPSQKIPRYIRGEFYVNDDLNHIIPRFHYIFKEDGTVLIDTTFYNTGGRKSIPESCTVKEWYQDIAYEGNGYIIDEIIAAGGASSIFDSKRQGRSWNPTVTDVDAKLLGRAQAMCADLGIYGPFASYKEFFKQLMLIDWSTDRNNNYRTDYNNRLGLTLDQAQRLVHDYGLKWNTDPAAPIEYLFTQTEEWWNDFEKMYNINDGRNNQQWAQMAFLYMYQQMTNPSVGSGQVHLMFNPQEFHEQYPGWTSPDNIAEWYLDEHDNVIWTEWDYPGDPTFHLAEMGYFPISFFNQMLNANFHVTGRPQNYLVDIEAYLKEIWKKWHPT